MIPFAGNFLQICSTCFLLRLLFYFSLEVLKIRYTETRVTVQLWCRLKCMLFLQPAEESKLHSQRPFQNLRAIPCSKWPKKRWWQSPVLLFLCFYQFRETCWLLSDKLPLPTGLCSRNSFYISSLLIYLVTLKNACFVWETPSH